MQAADQGPAIDLDGHDLVIGIVRARFNDAITAKLAQACLAELDRLEVDEGDIRHVSVPGALEIPVALKALAESGDYDALIALGCVIRGETYHFELVADQSGAGVLRVALDHGVPVANAILTVENEAQAWARADDKGRDAAALMPQVLPGRSSAQPARTQMDLRTYGVGAQILRSLGVGRMRLLGSPRRMPSMTGYGLEITGFTAAPSA